MGIGAKLGRPTGSCICIVGDGSLLMHGFELHTAVRYNVPLVIVLINNSALGNVYLRARQEGQEAIELAAIPTLDWIGFAHFLGADGVVVEQPDNLGGRVSISLRSNRNHGQAVSNRCPLRPQLPDPQYDLKLLMQC
jgi:acetolactate synthase-1/2/3 large subunit